MDRGSASLKGHRGAGAADAAHARKAGTLPTTRRSSRRSVDGSAGRRARFAVCPYRGLAAFQPDDADRFFGRDALVAELVDRLDRDRVLFVVGPSGSGKSSAVRAGLIPAVGSGAVIPGSERWAVALFSPEREPGRRSSAYQLHRARSRREVHAAGAAANRHPHPPTRYARSPTPICDCDRRAADRDRPVRGAVHPQPSARPGGVRETARRRSSTHPAAGCALVIAMRADFYGVCATFPWLVRRATSQPGARRTDESRRPAQGDRAAGRGGGAAARGRPGRRRAGGRRHRRRRRCR